MREDVFKYYYLGVKDSALSFFALFGFVTCFQAFTDKEEYAYRNSETQYTYANLSDVCVRD